MKQSNLSVTLPFFLIAMCHICLDRRIKVAETRAVCSAISPSERAGVLVLPDPKIMDWWRCMCSSLRLFVWVRNLLKWRVETKYMISKSIFPSFGHLAFVLGKGWLNNYHFMVALEPLEWGRTMLPAGSSPRSCIGQEEGNDAITKFWYPGGGELFLTRSTFEYPWLNLLIICIHDPCL